MANNPFCWFMCIFFPILSCLICRHRGHHGGSAGDGEEPVTAMDIRNIYDSLGKIYTPTVLCEHLNGTFHDTSPPGNGDCTVDLHSATDYLSDIADIHDVAELCDLFNGTLVDFNCTIDLEATTSAGLASVEDKQSACDELLGIWVDGEHCDLQMGV